MKEDLLLSIIIPVYNVEKYLEDCLKSVANLNRENVEIIIVNDGSTDSSGSIADSLSELYPNMMVFHKDNGGLSDARNYGLKFAKGKFVFFLDSDDVIDSKKFSFILSEMKNCDSDVILWDAVVVNESGLEIPHKDNEYFKHRGLEKNKPYSGLEVAYNQLIVRGYFVTTVWLGAYSRDYLLSNNLYFEYGLLHEDELWTPKTLLNSSNVVYYDLTVYKYRLRENSIMSSKNKDKSKNLNDLIYIFNSMYAYYDWKVNDDYKCQLLKDNISQRFLNKVYKYEAYKYPKIFKKIDRIKILNESKSLKNKLRALILLINIRLYCFISNKIS